MKASEMLPVVAASYQKLLEQADAGNYIQKAEDKIVSTRKLQSDK